MKVEVQKITYVQESEISCEIVLEDLEIKKKNFLEIEVNDIENVMVVNYNVVVYDF